MRTDLKTLISNAQNSIDSVDVPEARELLDSSSSVFVDVREPTEYEIDGRIPGAINVPRGMLEFVIDRSSPYHNPLLDCDKTFVFYCKSGARSALAAQTAVEMGLSKVVSLRGGFLEWTKQTAPSD